MPGAAGVHFNTGECWCAPGSSSPRVVALWVCEAYGTRAHHHHTAPALLSVHLGRPRLLRRCCYWLRHWGLLLGGTPKGLGWGVDGPS